MAWDRIFLDDAHLTKNSKINIEYAWRPPTLPLRPKVLAELDLKYQWNILSVCNRGYNISGLHSSTTVVISCEDISNPIWTHVKVKVTELLKTEDT
jgi:hypothetical protein